MAVNLDELSSIGGYAQTIKEGKKAYLNLSNISYKKGEMNLDRTISLLTHYCERAKETEKNILRCFGVNSEQELKNSFKNFFEDSGLASFIGPKFYRDIVYRYKQNYKVGDAELVNYVQNVFVPYLQKEDEKIAGETLTQKAITVLKNYIEGDKNIKQSSLDFFDEDNNLLFEKLSTNRMAALKKMHQDFKNKKIQQETNFKKDKNRLKTTTKLNVYQATQGKKKSEATQEDYERLRSVLKEQIPLYFNKYNDISYKILEDMLMQQPESFFVGENSKDIIGVLGEYIAGVALNVLIPSTSVQQCIQWTAKNTAGKGGQISSDFIVNFSNNVNFGVQVKNTGKDFEKIERYDVPFIKNVAIQTIFNRLTSATGIDFNNFIDAYSSLIVSKDFNVPYIYYTDKNNNTTYQQYSLNPNPYTTDSDDSDEQEIINKKNKGFSNYINIRKSHLELLTQIKIFLASFAPYFLYMGIDQNFEGGLANLEKATAQLIGGGNNLYLVAGEPFFVSSMLQRIIEELKDYQKTNEYKMNSLTIESTWTSLNEENSFKGNIVDYKNSHKKEISVEVKLNSSYNFKA